MKRISNLKCEHSQNCEESEEHGYNVGFIASSNAITHGNWENAFAQICAKVARKNGILHYVGMPQTYAIAIQNLAQQNRIEYYCGSLSLEKRLEVMESVASAKNASYIFLTHKEKGAAAECYKKLGHLWPICVFFVDAPCEMPAECLNIDSCLCTMSMYPKLLEERLARLYALYGRPANYVVQKRPMLQAPEEGRHLHKEQLLAAKERMTTYYSKPVVDYFNVLFISTRAFNISPNAPQVLRHAISCLQRRRKDAIIHCVETSFVHENVRNVNESHIRVVDCSQEYGSHTERIDLKKEVELIWRMADFVHEMNFFDDPDRYFVNPHDHSKQPSVMDIIQDVKVKSGEKKFNLNVYHT